MSSYCHDCQIETVNYHKLEVVTVDGFKLYVHDICPNCNKKFYSPAEPAIKDKE